MKFIATIKDPTVIRKILEHFGLPLDGPSPAPALLPQVDFEEIVYALDCL